MPQVRQAGERFAGLRVAARAGAVVEAIRIQLLPGAVLLSAVQLKVELDDAMRLARRSSASQGVAGGDETGVFLDPPGRRVFRCERDGRGNGSQVRRDRSDVGTANLGVDEHVPAPGSTSSLDGRAAVHAADVEAPEAPAMRKNVIDSLVRVSSQITEDAVVGGEALNEADAFVAERIADEKALHVEPPGVRVWNERGGLDCRSHVSAYDATVSAAGQAAQVADQPNSFRSFSIRCNAAHPAVDNSCLLR